MRLCTAITFPCMSNRGPPESPPINVQSVDREFVALIVKNTPEPHRRLPPNLDSSWMPSRQAPLAQRNGGRIPHRDVWPVWLGVSWRRIDLQQPGIHRAKRLTSSLRHAGRLVNRSLPHGLTCQSHSRRSARDLAA